MWKKLFSGRRKSKPIAPDGSCGWINTSGKAGVAGTSDETGAASKPVVNAFPQLQDLYNCDIDPSSAESKTICCPEDIIRRNKRAVRMMSKRRQTLKLKEPCEFIRLIPVAPRRFRCKKKRRQPARKSSLVAALNDEKDCACEVMARAVGGGQVHKHLGLAELRDTINAGPVDPDPTPDPEESNSDMDDQ